MKKIEKLIWISISAALAFFIFLQHRYVYMYFDDYGYASLSYINPQNQAGTLYGLTDILEFLQMHYLHWGGRILYFFFEIVIFRYGGLTLMQFMQAVIIITIAVISGKIVSMIIKTNLYQCVMLSLLLFGTFHLKTLRDGIYWFSASVLYVWPLLPFFGSIYLYLSIEKKETSLKKAGCILLTFLAAFSQEQIAVMTILLVFFFIVIKYTKQQNKEPLFSQVPRYMFVMLITALIGGALTILAPGNFERAQAGLYSAFYNKNIIVRTVQNIGWIINDNFGLYNWAFVFIVTVFCGTAIIIYLKNKCLTISIITITTLLILERIIPVPKEIGVILGVFWILIFLPALVIYYYRKNQFLLLALLGVGFGSQFMMIVSPAVPLRSHIMMEFILHMVLTESIMYLLEKIKENKTQQILFHCGIILLVLYIVCNYVTITTGYKNNYRINQENHSRLLQAKEDYNVGKSVSEIVLYKLCDDNYANMMPYQEGYKNIETWMKRYYELPDEVTFQYCIYPNG